MSCWRFSADASMMSLMRARSRRPEVRMMRTYGRSKCFRKSSANWTHVGWCPILIMSNRPSLPVCASDLMHDWMIIDSKYSYSCGCCRSQYGAKIEPIYRTYYIELTLIYKLTGPDLDRYNKFVRNPFLETLKSQVHRGTRLLAIVTAKYTWGVQRWTTFFPPRPPNQIFH